VLARRLPSRARVLEIASGTGQHAVHFAASQPGWTWQPTDADPALVEAVAQRCAGLANVLTPLHLDVMAASWRVPEQLDAIYCANLLHIAPWATCAALMWGAARHLAEDGQLFLYGPYVVDDRPTAPSNLAFDVDLKARNAEWGVRRLADVEAEAARVGLALKVRVEMPANNLLLVFQGTAVRMFDDCRSFEIA